MTKFHDCTQCLPVKPPRTGGERAMYIRSQHLIQINISLYFNGIDNSEYLGSDG